MKLEIEITRQDYLDFNVHHFKKTRLAKTAGLGLVGLFFLLFLINKSKTNLNESSLVVPAILYIVLYSAIIYQGLYSSRKIPTEKGTVLGKKELHLTDDTLVYSDEYSNGSYRWPAIQSIEETKKSFYLYVDTNMAVVVPKRYFLKKEQEHEFRSFVQKKLSAA